MTRCPVLCFDQSMPIFRSSPTPPAPAHPRVAQEMTQILKAAGVHSPADWQDGWFRYDGHKALLIDGHLIEPSDEPGVLVVDGTPFYSDLWL